MMILSGFHGDSREIQVRSTFRMCHICPALFSVLGSMNSNRTSNPRPRQDPNPRTA